MSELDALAAEQVWSATSDRKVCHIRAPSRPLPASYAPSGAQLLAFLESFSARLADRLQAAEAQVRVGSLLLSQKFMTARLALLCRWLLWSVAQH